MTAIAARQGTTARHSFPIGHDLGHGLAWLWHSYLIVIQAFAHHQVPPTAPTVAFAATAAAVLLFLFRRRRRTAAA